MLDFAREQLGGEWTEISSRTKLRKILFEAEFNGRRVIGKVSGSARARTAFDSLTILWTAGLCPPARHTVVEPIAWFPERNLLIQEKAPGMSVLDAMQRQQNESAAVKNAAEWLKALWELDVDAKAEGFASQDAEDRASALAEATGDRRAQTIGRLAIETLGQGAGKPVGSHGDFHPMNLYVAEERVTAIDVDTFAKREKEADAAYFLAQSANLGLHMFGSFRETAVLRESFLRECGPLNLERVAAFMAWTLVKSLHYDVCILKVANPTVAPVLDAAERLLRTGAVDLPA